MIRTRDTTRSQDALFLKERREVSYARRGLLFALLAGFLWGVNSLCLEKGLSAPGCGLPEVWLLAPVLATFLTDVTTAGVSLAHNLRQGKGREILRSLRSKPSRYALLSASLGTPAGQGCYLIAVSLIDAAYAAPLVAAYPALAAVAGKAFLKERLTRSTIAGILLCVAGVAAITHVVPESKPDALFSAGLIFAALSCLGYTAESTLSGAAIDFIEPSIVITLERTTASLVDLGILIPGICLFTRWRYPDFSPCPFLGELFTSPTILFFFLAGLITYFCYLFFYKGISAAGVGRAVAMESTYGLWAIALSSFFTPLVVKLHLVLGGIVVFIGLALIAGNPRELVHLRSVQRETRS